MKRKTVFKILGGVALVIAAIVGLVFYATSGMTSAADKFFETARGGDMNAILPLTSAELRNTTTADELAGFIQANRFDRVAETSWSTRSVENGLGHVEGSVTLDDGGVIPLTMNLVKEGGDWKVSFIELREAGLSGGAGAAQTAANLPSDNEILGAVRFHTGLLLDAAQREGEAGLRSELEYFQQFWTGDITVDQLGQLVADMRGQRAAAAALSDARPVVEKVTPTDTGYRVEGHMAAAPWRYAYGYEFAPVGEEWKLTGFEYELSRAK